MDDLISRQAAIKAVEDLPNCYNGYSDTYDKSCIIGLLEELPSVQTHSEGLYIDGRNDGYREGWKDGREALRREIWEDGRDRLD